MKHLIVLSSTKNHYFHDWKDWWISLHHGNSQLRPLCERNTLQSCGQGCEQEGEMIETHHLLSSDYTKVPFFLVNIMHKTESSMNDMSIVQEKGATLSSNWSMKRSTPFTYMAWLSWVSITPLGWPLVPLVYMIVHISSDFGGQGWAGFSFPWNPIPVLMLN